jgi:hypothetical protein
MAFVQKYSVVPDGVDDNGKTTYSVRKTRGGFVGERRVTRSKANAAARALEMAALPKKK